MKISEFQKLIEDIYLDRDSQRGIDRNFVWFTEEVGELAREIRQEPRNQERLFEEFADVFASALVPVAASLVLYTLIYNWDVFL